MYMLKKGQPAIEIVDGPMAGRKFVPGVEYAEVPPQEKHRFSEVKKAAPKRPAVPAASETAKESAK